MDEKVKRLLEDLERYIQENYVPPEKEESQKRVEAIPDLKDSAGDFMETEIFPDDTDLYGKAGDTFLSDTSLVSLEDLFAQVGKTFHEVLFEKIAKSGMTDVEVYRRANLDRKLFSKIRTNPAYHPRKETILALAVALKMDLDETKDLLSRADYALSPSRKSDIIIRYFIERGIYDIDLINIALDDHGLNILE